MRAKDKPIKTSTLLRKIPVAAKECRNAIRHNPDAYEVRLHTDGFIYCRSKNPPKYGTLEVYFQDPRTGQWDKIRREYNRKITMDISVVPDVTVRTLGGQDKSRISDGKVIASATSVFSKPYLVDVCDNQLPS